MNAKKELVEKGHLDKTLCILKEDNCCESCREERQLGGRISFAHMQTRSFLSNCISQPQCLVVGKNHSVGSKILSNGKNVSRRSWMEKVSTANPRPSIVALLIVHFFRWMVLALSAALLTKKSSPRLVQNLRYMKHLKNWLRTNSCWLSFTSTKPELGCSFLHMTSNVQLSNSLRISKFWWTERSVAAARKRKRLRTRLVVVEPVSVSATVRGRKSTGRKDTRSHAREVAFRKKESGTWKTRRFIVGPNCEGGPSSGAS